MAGGKETPRQKLINLMYLVLLAMLALQVSSAIIQKFVFLNKSLERALDENLNRNVQTVSAIQAAVDKRGNLAQDKQNLAKAQELRERSKALIDEMNDIKRDLILKTGDVDPETGEMKGAKDEDITAQVMVGGGNSKNGRAYELQQKLNEYAKYVSDLSSERDFPLLALDAKDDPITENDPDQKRKDFAELNFAQTPMVAALAVLTDKQNKVATYESIVLNELANDLDVKVDLGDFIPMARAESRVVAAGTKYKAEMFLSTQLLGVSPVMRWNGGEIPVNEQGIGTIEFTASGGNYDKDGNMEKTWTADIVAPDPMTGQEKTYTVTEKYIVAKPVMQIQSASVQALYRNCGNELNVQVPALGATYDPSFSVQGGSASKGAKKGEVVIVPTAQTATLTVSSGGNTIGTQKFSVRPVPRPDIVPYAGSSVIDLKRGVDGCPRGLTIAAVADPDFEAMLPKEARYAVTSYKVYLARGKRPIGTVDASSQTVNLTSLAQKAQPGDRLVVEVEGVKRKNYQGKVENVPIPTSASIINIPIN
ncbi:MAG: gliding motility protein GldM [Catalinimonas sp.]